MPQEYYCIASDTADGQIRNCQNSTALQQMFCKRVSTILKKHFVQSKYDQYQFNTASARRWYACHRQMLVSAYADSMQTARRKFGRCFYVCLQTARRQRADSTQILQIEHEDSTYTLSSWCANSVHLLLRKKSFQRPCSVRNIHRITNINCSTNERISNGLSVHPLLSTHTRLSFAVRTCRKCTLCLQRTRVHPLL